MSTQEGNMIPATNSEIKTVFDLRANRSVTIPIWTSALGLIFSVLLFTLKSCNIEDGPYRDVLVKNDTASIYKIFNRRIDTLKGNFLAVKDTLDNKNKARVIWRNAERDLFMYRYFYSDTSFRYFKQTIISPEQLVDGLNNINDKNSLVISGKVYDTSSIIDRNPFIADANIVVTRKNSSITKLIIKYPTFGFWFFFNISQMTLWFLVVALVFGIVVHAKETKPIISGFKNYWPSYLIPLIIIPLFVGANYFFVLRSEPIIRESYFLDGYRFRMTLYGIIGYIAAIVCLGSFLFLANKLELLNLMRKKDIKNETIEEDVKAYNQLKASFDFVFILSATILSAFVLWAGLLFNFINSVDGMRLYTFYTEKSFLNYDFVYLIGLFHTLILMIFYIPVRIQFNALEITQEQKLLETNITGSKKYFKAIWESLSAVLLTASPILTSILQNFISNIFS